MTTSFDLHRQPFAYRPGVDGCDATFDVVHQPTDSVIAACPYWDDKAAARRAARQFVNALNAMCGYAYINPQAWRELGELLSAT